MLKELPSSVPGPPASGFRVVPWPWWRRMLGAMPPKGCNRVHFSLAWGFRFRALRYGGEREYGIRYELCGVAIVLGRSV